MHSLTGCKGELTNKEIDVKIKDENEKTIYSDKVITRKNGFVGLWLPKNIRGKLTITYDKKVGTVPISTSLSSPTCITDLRLI